MYPANRGRRVGAGRQASPEWRTLIPLIIRLRINAVQALPVDGESQAAL